LHDFDSLSKVEREAKFIKDMRARIRCRKVIPMAISLTVKVYFP